MGPVKVSIAASFWDNWRGVKNLPAEAGLILRRRSVHTFGLRRQLLGVGVDAAGTVLAVKAMTPNRMFYFPGSTFVVELPRVDTRVNVGDQLSLSR